MLSASGFHDNKMSQSVVLQSPGDLIRVNKAHGLIVNCLENFVFIIAHVIILCLADPTSPIAKHVDHVDSDGLVGLQRNSNEEKKKR